MAVITIAHRQEALSLAYVQIVAARCGMSWSFPSPDYGIDITLNFVDSVDGRLVETGDRLDVQLKSTTTAVVEDTVVRYRLDVGAYDKLSIVGVGTDRILVLLVLPRPEADWTAITEEQLILRRCAYWLSLKGMESVENRSKVTIRIPRVNVFSAEALRAIMDRVRNGAEL